MLMKATSPVRGSTMVTELVEALVSQALEQVTESAEGHAVQRGSATGRFW